MTDLQEELRKYPRKGTINDWWNNANDDLKGIIGNISIRLDFITPNTPWDNNRTYENMLRTKQRLAIDKCAAMLSYDWAVVEAGMIKFV